MTEKAFDDGLGIKQCVSLIINLVNFNLQTTIVIDALDELKIFLSSRKDDDIELEFKNEPNISIDVKDNTLDIELYVREEVARCIDEKKLLRGNVDGTLKELVISSLLTSAAGMFLWVELQIRALCKVKLPEEVRGMLNHLPKTLLSTFENIYHRIRSQEGLSPMIAKTVLMWVMCACIPLSPNDLSAMVSLSFGVELGIDDLLAMCHNLLKVDEALNVVRFFHLSVTEFLEKESWFTILEANTMAGEFCLSLLNNPPEPRCIEKYIILYWPIHLELCLGTNHAVWEMLNVFFGDFNKPSMAYTAWLKRIAELKPTDSSIKANHKWSLLVDHQTPPQVIAAHFGFFEEVRSLWDEKELAVDIVSSNGEPLLHVAIKHENLVRMLLDRGADVNKAGGCYGHALQAAAQGGDERMVQIMLDVGADLNAQGGKYGNALQAAATNGYENILQLLLYAGAEVNAQSILDRHQYALQAAAFNGYERLVEILLDAGADVNAQTRSGGNALQSAAANGHEKVMQILLDRDADVNAAGGYYRSALQASSSNGHEQGVRILLDAGAHVNAQGNRWGNRNALQGAVFYGHENVVRVLLRRGADVNAIGGRFGNALQVAASKGNETLVQVLLDAGADINAGGAALGAALQVAAFHGYENVVRILIDAGADVNGRGAVHGAALQVAAFKGHEKVVRILLDAGADVNAQGGDRGNALQGAAEYGYEGVVRMLLDKGADVNAQGGGHGNALQAAASFGHEDVLRILLDAGADVNVQTDKYGNALQGAAEYGHEDVLRILLDEGADVNAHGGKYGNALQAAASKGYEKLVRILLEKGADINTEGGLYRNALRAARKNSETTTWQLLLDNGADFDPALPPSPVEEKDDCVIC